MLAKTFSVLSTADMWFAHILPLWLRISFWGVASGTLAIGIYALISNQAEISVLKTKARELRRQLLSPNLEHHAFFAAVKSNFKVSLTMLGKVVGPSLLSALPILLMVVWLYDAHGYSLPPDDQTLRMTVFPAERGITVRPENMVRRDGDGWVFTAPNFPPEGISVYVGDDQVYSGNPFLMPTPFIGKSSWWSFLIGSRAGYVVSDASVDEIRLEFSRKRLIVGLPKWASTWELLFFLSVFAAALPIKLLFRIQ